MHTNEAVQQETQNVSSDFYPLGTGDFGDPNYSRAIEDWLNNLSSVNLSKQNGCETLTGDGNHDTEHLVSLSENFLEFNNITCDSPDANKDSTSSGATISEKKPPKLTKDKHTQTDIALSVASSSDNKSTGSSICNTGSGSVSSDSAKMDFFNPIDISCKQLPMNTLPPKIPMIIQDSRSDPSSGMSFDISTNSYRKIIDPMSFFDEDELSSGGDASSEWSTDDEGVQRNSKARHTIYFFALTVCDYYSYHLSR